ncbi:MAG: O-antigen ligase family protein [Oscillospiraceae bacterium]|nr:O-antigen ligase family protein [Oscillospiraceae bacterium]
MTLKINKTVLIIFLLVFPFFPMKGLTFLGLRQFSYLYEVLKGIIVILLGLRLFIKGIRGGKKTGSVLVCMIGLSLVTYLSTYLNNGSFIHATDRLLSLWGAFLIVEYGMGKKHETFIRGLCVTLNIIALINLLGIFLFYSRGSLRDAGDFWLFGQKNSMKVFLMPCVAFNLIYDVHLGLRMSKRTILMTLIACFCVVIVKSATSSVVVLAMAMLFYAYRKWGFNKARLKVFVIVFLVLQVLIVGMRAIGVFSFVISRFLNRDLTLSGRIMIWDSALRGIRAHPLLGTGIQILEDSDLTTLSGSLFSQAHNVLLDALYKTGIVGLAFMVALCVFALRGLKKGIGLPVCYIINVLLGSILITGLVGDVWHFGFFAALFYASHVNDIEAIPAALQSHRTDDVVPFKNRISGGEKYEQHG